MNTRNIASRNTAQPLYCVEADVGGIHVAVQGYDLEKAREELWEEIEKVEILSMGECAEVDSLVDRLFPRAGEMDDLREQMAAGL